MHITGTIVFEDIEGGVWGLVADDGTRFEITEQLPKHIREDGARVEAEVETLEQASIFMWGQPISLISVRRI